MLTTEHCLRVEEIRCRIMATSESCAVQMRSHLRIRRGEWRRMPVRYEEEESETVGKGGPGALH